VGLSIAVPAFAVIAVLSSCAVTPEKPQTPLQPQAKPQPVEYQRFLPIPENPTNGAPWSGYFALDTQTGQLCRTTAIPAKLTPLDALISCISLSSHDSIISASIFPPKATAAVLLKGKIIGYSYDGGKTMIPLDPVDEFIKKHGGSTESK
jgi:hypothetical protein